MQPQTLPPSFLESGHLPPNTMPQMAASGRVSSYAQNPRLYFQAQSSALYADFAGPPQDLNAAVPMPIKPAKAEIAEPTILKVRPKTVFLASATLVMFLLLVIPIWNSIGLLEDPLYTYMAGSEITAWLLACCILLLVISHFSILVFLNRSRPEMRTEQTMLMIAGIFLSTLGIMLILFGGPLGREAKAASDQFFIHCKTGERSRPLYIASEELESLRKMPTCIIQNSVEDCVGFQAYPKMREAKVLKVMESRLLCSGLCQGVDSKGKRISPPTLFNRANYTLSCDGMAARHMRNYAFEISKQTVTEGIMLVVTAIVISFGQLVSFCARSPQKREEAAHGKDYGATL